MFREVITPMENIHKNHKDVYEHTGVVIDLNYLREISDTSESKKALDIFIDSCKDYYVSIKKLGLYLTDNNLNDADYQTISSKLAIEQSTYHNVVEEKLREFISVLESEKKDISWSVGFINNRQEIGRFAALFGEGE